MANSRLEIYQDCAITPEKLFRVDDLELYLNSLTALFKTDFQFVKHQLKLSIVINMSQYGLAYNMYNLNYIKITNQTDSLGVAFPVYYFIVNKKWTSMEAVTFELEMDTLNTFTEANNSFEWDKKTKINRQHKDRYYRVGTEIFPIIDKLSEDINPILFLQHSTPVIADFNTDWYLIYMNKNNPTPQDTDNPVNCFLCASDEINIRPNQPVVVGRIYPNMLVDNKYYYYDVSTPMSFELSDGTTISFTNFDNLVFYAINGKLVISKVHRYVSVQPPYVAAEVTQYISDYLKIPSNITCGYTSVLDLSLTLPQFDGNTTFYSGNYPTLTLSKISDIDRTDSKIIKIIKLPYAPSSFTFNDDVMDYPTDWIYESIVQNGLTKNLLQLKNLDIKFKNRITFNNSPLALLNAIENTEPLSQIAAKDNGTDDDIEETKLLHSEFYNETFVYDTFRFTYQMEYAYSLSGYVESMFIDFIVTSTMNSKFMFQFIDYDTPGYGTSDYNNILVIARNNELPLYNSAYLNYIRNGFNYDVKTKERNEASTWLGVGLTFLGAGASALSSVFTGGIGIAGAIGLATSGVAQIANAINTTQQADQNLKQKLEQYRNQAVSVSGSDDVDLMSKYCENRLQKITYSPSSEMLNLIEKLFYYSGYKENAFGVPNLNTRYWFNFIMCDLVMKSTSNLTEEIKQDLINKYALGVTIFHNRGTQTSPQWNLEQTKENIEMSLEYVPSIRIVEVTATISKLNEGKEWVLNPNMNPQDVGRIQTSSHNYMVAQKRRRSDLSIIEGSEIDIGRAVVKNTDDEFTFNEFAGSSSYPAIIRELISEYPSKDYYWTIRARTGSIDSYYQEQNYLGSLLGYIEED